VAAVGEERLIRKIRQWLGAACPPAPEGIGDDCAVLPVASRLITVDPVGFGRHFDATVPPGWVGAKLLKRNLSDIAAMGGAPTSAVVALTLAPAVSVAWLERFYRGLAAAARKYQVSVVGGDVSEGGAAVFAASLTLLGNPAGKRVVTRSGARIGDYLYVTGVLGGSLASGHHYKFTPRLAEGAWFAGRREVMAMMDLSDGLAKDVHALEPKSAAASLFAAALPARKGASTRAALVDGEDYELLVAVDPGADLWRFESAFARRFPAVRLTRIGQMMRRGRPAPGALVLRDVQGYEHLS
jgi:thiamine-monophosphate kinase